MSLDHQSKTTVKVTGYQFSGCPATAGLGLLCKNQTARERRTEATSYDWSPRFTPKGAHGDRGRCIRSTWLDSWLYLVCRGLKKKDALQAKTDVLTTVSNVGISLSSERLFVPTATWPVTPSCSLSPGGHTTPRPNPSYAHLRLRPTQTSIFVLSRRSTGSGGALRRR